jgi:hypothetical protein
MEQAMRLMLRFTIPVEKGNEAVADGSLSAAIKSDQAKPLKKPVLVPVNPAFNNPAIFDTINLDTGPHDLPAGGRYTPILTLVSRSEFKCNG